MSSSLLQPSPKVSDTFSLSNHVLASRLAFVEEVSTLFIVQEMEEITKL
jgi:hypothetical protein